MSLPIPMPVHDPKGSDDGARSNRSDYLEPMGELWNGPRELTPAALAALVRWMDVANSLRWQKREITVRRVVNGKPTQVKKTATYCDHYTADFLFQLFRRHLVSAWVWWSKDALARIRKGEKVEAVYNVTTVEHGAKGLHSWLKEFGAEFGWRKEKDESGLKTVLNAQTTIGIITTATHVAVALPDACGPLLGVADGPVILTSQAGSRNVMAWRQNDWFRRNKDVQFYSYQGPTP